jgi:hypothetical protein
MFLREKTINGYTYLYLVESLREGARTRQRIIKNLGRKDAALASGELDRLAASVARFAERALVLAQVESGNPDGLTCRRIGPPLLFGRLWQDAGIQAVLKELLGGRAFEFQVERAVFAATLHRLMAPGSDRACEKWMADYAIPDSENLALHHFYRAMAWLGEELPEAEQAGATPFAPRCVKDLIEERMVAQRRDLFSELSVVFMDTTTLSFVGAGGAMLGRRGHSKDHRPELMQMVLGVVIDADGRPVCTEMWPGNTADVCALLPIVDRLRTRFAIGRVCVVADRGMISQPTIAALEERGLEYVLGVRERTDSLVRRVVLEDRQPFTPLCVPRANGAETQLWVKEMVVEGRRYVVCRNEAEANKGAADRKAVLDGLERQLRKGDKALIGNSAYRRFLKSTAKKAFEIDPGKVADEARFDGIFVLRTNAGISPLQAVLRYRDLLQVEDLFRTAKALLRIRPIYHSSDAAIRGHVFCSFLALVLRKELDDRCHAADFRPEWADVQRDLDRLQEVELAKVGKRMILRTPATGTAGRLFQAAHIALPPNMRDADTAA